MARTKSKSNTAEVTKTLEADGANRRHSKKERVLALLRREGGATLEQVVETTGWLPHSARAVFTGLRKKGFSLERIRTDGATCYAITAEPSA